MTYTLWHSGILIGESDFEEGSLHPRQRGGVFRPTAYGREVLPRLSGLLSTGHALKSHLAARSLSADTIQPAEIEELLDTTDVGEKLLDLGRMLSEVEVRAPDGRRLEFESIAFTDVLEVQRLARALEVPGADDLPELPPDAPRHIVSATFRDDPSVAGGAGGSGHFRRLRWPDDN